MATPNMSLTLPTDHDSADVWGVILATAFGVIDSHNHAPGSGATILMSSLKVDADISWAFGGAQRAITDLRAIDFSPQPVTAMASLAGGLFLSDGTGGLVANELYYRTTGGANIQVTNGATLNVAAFVGGIGGDYTAVGALEIFDDASDAFVFQQQVGASVRQYAKLRSSDLQLYEFKAVGSTPAPSFSVSLRSPTALAAPYALTLPGALPGSQQLVQVDASGNVVLSNTVPNNVSFGATVAFGATETYSVAFAAAAAGTTTNQGTSIQSPSISLGTVTSGAVNCPIRARIGTTITAWQTRITKTTSSASTVSVKLWKASTISPGSAPTQIGSTQSNSANNPGAVSPGQSGLTEVVAANTSYFIEVIGSGSAGDAVFDYQVTTA